MKENGQWFRQNCSNSDKVTHEEIGLGVLKEHRFKGVFFQWKRGLKSKLSFHMRTNSKSKVEGGSEKRGRECNITSVLLKILKLRTKK